MSRIVRLIFIAFLLIGISVPPFAFAKTTTTTKAAPKVRLFYYNDTDSGYDSLKAHASSIDILAPQSYAVDTSGALHGKVSDRTMKVVKAHKNIKLVPLVVNQGFDQEAMHAILTNTLVQDTIIENLIAEAKEKKFYGWQFDFEHIIATDKELYADFIERTGPEFKKAKLSFSVAVGAHDATSESTYPPDSWLNWSGAFDYARIGATVDFVSIMTYDEPNSAGPTASLPWMDSVISYAITQIPGSKISLGIPLYSWSWTENDHIFVGTGGFKKIRDRFKTLTYLGFGKDDTLGVPWIRYNRDGVNYQAWYEDSGSFAKKVALMKKYKLKGYSVWVLGLEDPKIWPVVTKSR